MLRGCYNVNGKPAGLFLISRLHLARRVSGLLFNELCRRISELDGGWAVSERGWKSRAGSDAGLFLNLENGRAQKCRIGVDNLGCFLDDYSMLSLERVLSGFFSEWFLLVDILVRFWRIHEHCSDEKFQSWSCCVSFVRMLAILSVWELSINY